MTELKINIPDDLEKKMKEHPEINWTSIARKAIEKYLKNLDLHEEPITNKELEELTEHSLREFLEREPDIYTDQDLVKRCQ
ncbi:MAG: hypothetical protein GF383_08710 [Candidatus Lokiarchaeota archaeon]|nr:hypothetical protein [Candidatus Lokiarchaeota archaeon]MBD3340460.1 hypothetical protein [Candidatus Lokiarchaeota archaeon]